MNKVLQRPEQVATNGAAIQARLESVKVAKPPRQPTRRRWGRIGAGVAAAVLGAWLFAALYMSAGHRTEALVLTKKVARFELLQRTDLRVVRISADTEAAHVPASQLDAIVGRTAATDLVEGSMLAEGQLLVSGEKLLHADEAVVGVLLGAGDAQMSLRRGSRVVAIVRPAQGDTAPPTEVTGWVFNSSAEALNSRERPIEIAVPRANAALISAAGADKRVTIVALPE